MLRIGDTGRTEDTKRIENTGRRANAILIIEDRGKNFAVLINIANTTATGRRGSTANIITNKIRPH